MAHPHKKSSRALACACVVAFAALGCSSEPASSGVGGSGSGGGGSSGSSGADSGSSSGAGARSDGGPGGSGSGGGDGAAGSGGGPDDAGAGDSTLADAPGGGIGDAAVGGDGASLPLPTRDEYLTTLYGLCDTLIATQITQTGAANYGALVSQSTNPTMHPVHSRAAEAVYPLAVAYKYSQKSEYAQAAVILGDWLVSIQNSAGYWVEEWPAATGWTGTSADQTISLAGAYPILKPMLSTQQAGAWEAAISSCANWMLQSFPAANINYTPTEAVALVLASQAVANPDPQWLATAASLMSATVTTINADGFIVGEGTGGVDLGYNIAQSIGEMAIYGRLTGSQSYVAKAAELLRSHSYFMYPTGAIDNSWGTRSFKWILESGTKTAPGVHAAFALLEDQDPSFVRGAQLALAFLRGWRDSGGWLVYGPNGFEHPDSNPPDNYSTFARAQSLATAVELGATASAAAPVPADSTGWFKYFPTVNTGVVRTSDIMATVTAYGSIASYPRESVVRGGSISALWFAGYGSTGFLQVSSQATYTRIEALHMPTEGALLPLTPRIETASGTYFTNVFDDSATLAMTQAPGGAQATAGGVLRDATGASSGTQFSWSYEFGASSYSKEVQISSAAGVRIVEPFVDNPGNQYALVGGDTFQIATAAGGVWQVKVVSSSGPYVLTAGTDQAKYWSPFPGFQCYPLLITPGRGNAGSYTIKYTVSRTK
jgi:hypothetical protein